MPSPYYITRQINLEPEDYQIVWRTALEKGLGRKGFSAALRLIIREWQALRPAAPGAGPEPRKELPQPPAGD